MDIAIFGATSQIAKDLIQSFAKHTDHACTLFARDASVVATWLHQANIGKDYGVSNYSDFSADVHYDVIINFVGIGDPAQAKKMGGAIFEATYQYDKMILEYLKSHQSCKYLFLSSGAVYGGGFESPATHESQALIPINTFNETNWYMIAKLYAEANHRALPNFAIVDIRVFNYFSHTQDLEASFLITEVARAIRKNKVFKTSADNIVRDYITPPDFFNLVESILQSPPTNMPVDCYTKEPVGKLELLDELEKKFGLHYEFVESVGIVNVTGLKVNYYSMQRDAEQFGYVPQHSSVSGIFEQIEKI